MSNSADPIKQCPMCGTQFTLHDIVESPSVRVIGMSFDDDLEHNLYYFQHDAPGCGTCFTVPVLAFTSLVDEPVPLEILAGTPACEGHCRNVADHSLCRQTCKYAPFRRLLRSMQARSVKTAETTE